MQMGALALQGVKEVDEKMEEAKGVMSEQILYADALINSLGLGLNEEQHLQVVSNAEALAEFSVEAENLKQVAKGVGVTLETLMADVEVVQQLLRENALDRRLIALENAQESDKASDEEIVTIVKAELSPIASWNYELWTFIGEVTFKARATFESSVEFLANVTFGGKTKFEDQITVSADTAGKLTIPTGETTVKVIFDGEYPSEPIITLTQIGSAEIDYSLEEITTTSFVVTIKPVQDNEVSFNWFAVAGSDTQIETIPQASPIPTLTPTPSATPDPSSSPTPEPSPTLEPTLSPSPSPEPSSSPSPQPEADHPLDESPSP